MFDYWEILPLALALIPGFYLGLPLLIRMQQRFPAEPKLKVLDLERLDRKIAKFLMTRAKALFEVGFEEPTLVRLPDPVPNVSGYLIMLVNRHSGDKAMVTALVGHGPAPIQTCYVEFSTRFKNGDVFNTMNSKELNAFPPAPQTVRTQTPSVTDPVELFHLHTFVMNKHDASGKKVLYEPGAALDYLVEYAFIKMYDIQVKRGWLSYDRVHDCYQPTIKGAYLICWGLMQPFKALRYAALRRREKAILEEFEQAAPPS
jgi:hypothetical protein